MPPNNELDYIEDFFSTLDSERIYQQLLEEQDWPENSYHYAGRQFKLPRLQTWHADSGIRYSYSHILLVTRSWTPLLLTLRAKIEAYVNTSFNAVLVNYYRDGQDHVGWHADDEPELGEQPVIASLTLGAERIFAFKHKKTDEKGELTLHNGSLLVMQPAFQQNWLHSLPKMDEVIEGRLNLTFRRVVN